ncbi:MAG: hypothetical protein CMK59_03405 [Proteobacteria bacterium]|nr:hypothetical protein [Pseudomonadota bacterium]
MSSTHNFAVRWIIISALIVIAYEGIVQSPFVYDDKIEVIGNATIRVLEKWEYIASYNPARILLLFSYAYNFNQSGLDPTLYHQYNIAIQVLSAGAALWTAESLGRLAKHPAPLFCATLITSIWALHPMCTESVTYITGRSESLCFLFCITSIGSWTQALLAQSHPTQGWIWAWRLLGIALAFCAAMTKEVGLMVPFALLTLEVLLGTEKTKWAWFLPFMGVLGLGICARLYMVVGNHPEAAGFELLSLTIPKEADRSLSTQLTTQAEVWLRYVSLWVVPINQTIYHHISDVSLFSLRGAGAWTGWLGLFGFLWWRTKENKLARFALICAFLFLLPSSSVAPLKESMAEHRSHQLGFYLIALCSWQFVKNQYPLIWLIPSALMVCGLTHHRNEVWKTEVGIWKEATERHPNIGEAWYGLGDALRFADRHQEAEQAFQKCVRLDPNYIEGWNNLGLVRIQMNDPDGAIVAWETALRKNPKHCSAHNNLGLLASRSYRWQAAIQEFQATLQHCPRNAIAHYSLGSIYYEYIPDKKKAIFHFERLLEIHPSFERSEEVRSKLLDLTW